MPIINADFGGLQIEFVLAPEKKTSEKTSEKIIQLLAIESDITIAELSKRIGITERSIERSISQLQKNNKIVRVGPDKGGYWKVILNEN